MIYLLEETISGREEGVDEQTLLRGVIALLTLLVHIREPLHFVQTEDDCQSQRVPQSVLLLNQESQKHVLNVPTHINMRDSMLFKNGRLPRLWTWLQRGVRR